MPPTIRPFNPQSRERCFERLLESHLIEKDIDPVRRFKMQLLQFCRIKDPDSRSDFRPRSRRLSAHRRSRRECNSFRRSAFADLPLEVITAPSPMRALVSISGALNAAMAADAKRRVARLGLRGFLRVEVRSHDDRVANRGATFNHAPNPGDGPVDVRVGNNAAIVDDCPLILCVRNPPDPRRAPTRIHFLLDAVVLSDSTFSRNAKNVPWKNGQRRRIIGSLPFPVSSMAYRLQVCAEYIVER